MRRLLVAVLALGAVVPAQCGDRDFDAVVRGIESSFNARRMKIPMWGFFRFVANVAARPQGVKQLDVAIFEDLSIPESRFGDLDEIVRKATGERWRPMIRVRERGGEYTVIYAQAAGKDLRLLVATAEPSEVTVVKMKANPERLARMLDQDPSRVGECYGSGSEQCPE